MNRTQNAITAYHMIEKSKELLNEGDVQKYTPKEVAEALDGVIESVTEFLCDWHKGNLTHCPMVSRDAQQIENKLMLYLMRVNTAAFQHMKDQADRHLQYRKSEGRICSWEAANPSKSCASLATHKAGNDRIYCAYHAEHLERRFGLSMNKIPE